MDVRIYSSAIIFVLLPVVLLAEQLGYGQTNHLQIHCANFMDQCIWKSPAWTKDRNYTTSALWRTKSENLGVCGIRRLQDKRCLSFAYNFKDKTCQCHNIRDYDVVFVYTPELGILNYQLEGCKLRLIDFVANSSEQDQVIYNGVLTEPKNAVDGDKSTMFHSKVTYDNFAYPFWEVSWTGLVNVTKILVFKRPTLEHRFQRVTTFVGIAEMLQVCDTLDNPSNHSMAVFQCSRPIEGNVVKIEHRGPLMISSYFSPHRVLEMTEVEIYGR